MITVRRRSLLAWPSLLAAQENDVDFVCPMDRDVHAKLPGQCPRCGMRLVAGLLSPIESRVRLTVEPRRALPGQPLRIVLRIEGNPKLQLMHERLFHLFVIGPGLEHFAHEHPRLEPDGSFVLETRLPTPGEYRLLCDFYPERGTPQMVAKTLILPGTPPPARALAPNLAPQQLNSLTVAIASEPTAAVAAERTRLLFSLDPFSKLEPFLGSWGHMLIASADRQDLIHTHPFLAYPERGHLQFNVIFPRPGLHRVWLQVQRAGQVLTAQFDVPVQRRS